MEDVFEEISTRIPVEVCWNAYTILLKLLDNIISDPNNPKFRTLRRSNGTICKKLLLSDLPNGEGVALERLLLRLGFVQTNEGFQFPPNADIEELQANRDIILGISQSLNVDETNMAVTSRQTTLQNSSSQCGGVGQRPEGDEGPASPETCPAQISNRPPDAKPLKRRDDGCTYQRATEDLQSWRAERAQHFQQNSTPQPSYWGGEGTSSSSSQPSDGSGVSGFFKSLFGSSGSGGGTGGSAGSVSSRPRERRDDTSRPRMKTLKDIQPPARKG